MSSVPQTPQPGDNALLQFQGRNFSRFGLENSIHCCPVDHVEQDNFDYIDEIFNELLGRRILPRINLNELNEPAILDCGYGTGVWIDRVLAGCTEEVLAVPKRALADFGQAVGIDVFTGRGNGSGHESDGDNDEDEEPFAEFVKKRWNLNASFRACNDRYLRPESFDLINSRFLTDGLNNDRWETYVRELKSLLVPGGWLQMVEVHMLFQSDSGRDTDILDRWWQWYEHSLRAMNKRARVARQLGEMMRDAGFDQIHHNVLRLPVGPWMDGKEALGNMMLRLMRDMLGSSSLWPFLRISAMPLQQYATLIQGARQVLEQPGMKLYLNVYVAYGRRPSQQRR